MTVLEGVWRTLKVRRRLQLGPVAVAFNFMRAVRLRAPRRGPGMVDGMTQAKACPQPVPATQAPSVAGTALIVGCGPGLGEALARKLAAGGFEVALCARDGQRLEPLAQELCGSGRRAGAYACDASSEPSVKALFDRLDRDLGTLDLVVYAVQDFSPGDTVAVEAAAYEQAWRHNCLGAFLVSKLACDRMAAVGRGTMILIGSTSSVSGRAGHVNLAVGKFGQRALAQVLSQEMWKLGVHVAHVLIDADIREGAPRPMPQADPGDIADALLFLHRQPRSAWTSEMDLRPWNEVFWQHC